MKRLRIAHIHWGFPPIIGGVETHLTILLPELIKKGHKVGLLTGTVKGEKKQYKYKGIEIYRSPLFDLNWLAKRGLDGLEKKISKTYNDFFDKIDPDIIHVHNMHYFSEPHTKILEEMSLHRDIPLILTAHNIWDDDTFLELTLDIKWDRIIAVSEFVRRELIGVGVPPEKVVTIHHGIDIQRFRKAKQNVLNKYPQLKDKRIILHPARMSLSKGCDVSVKALRIIKEEFPNILLVFTGTKNVIDWDTTKQKDIAYIFHLIKRLEVEDSVFANVFSYEEIVDLYRVSEFSIYPSTSREPFGLTMLESLASGKPMIVTKSGGMPEVIKDGVNGFLVETKDYEQLAQRCLQLLRDEKLKKKLGERGRKIAMERFTKERMVKDTLKVYEET